MTEPTSRYPQLSDWSREPSDVLQRQHSSNANKENNVNANEHQQTRSQFQHKTQKMSSFLQVLLLSLLTGVLIFTVVLPIWLISATTTTNNLAVTVTTTPPSISSVFWSFDQNVNDLYNNYNGITVNGPTYVTGYTGLNSSALDMVAGSSQYVRVSSPFLNLTYRSSTVEMWFYPTVLTSSDYGLFGQCQSLTTDHCLVYLIRNYKVYLAFFSDDLNGITPITINKWYHVAFVYDYSTSSQSLYLNGFLESTRLSNVYQGMDGTITIGAVKETPIDFFSGYIDLVSVVIRAKNGSEILTDATLVCYYSFDSNPYVDSGPLGLNGSGVSLLSANGRVNDAISLTSSLSYFVFGGLSMLGTVGQSYSMSIWIKPTSVSGGTIIHVSMCNWNCGANWCLAFLGFSSSGEIVAQSWDIVGGNHLVNVTGPVLLTNTWTHIVHTYSPANGICLYLNGLLFDQSTPFTYAASGSPDYVYLGNFPLTVCVPSGNVISMGQYYGLIDEFYLYSREITAVEVSALANP